MAPRNALRLKRCFWRVWRHNLRPSRNADIITIIMDNLSIEQQDAIRHTVPSSTVGYQDGQLLLSRVGVLHMAEEIIQGRTVGNVAAAEAMKAQILRDYPKP